MLAACSVYYIFHARAAAEKVMQTLKEKYDVQIEINEYISRDEMEIYDKYLNYSYIQLLFSLPIIVLGKMGRWALCSEKSATAFRVQRKGRKVLFVWFLFFLLICYQCHLVGQFYKRMVPQKFDRENYYQTHR